jgi:hypothetical protein
MRNELMNFHSRKPIFLKGLEGIPWNCLSEENQLGYRIL